MNADSGAEADAALLRCRLVEAGLDARAPLTVHENRRVLVHVRAGRVRVHRGFAYAPDRVLRALAAFALAPTARAAAVARRELVSFPVHDYVPAPAPGAARRSRPGERAVVGRLRAMHAALNVRHFGGALAEPAFELSRRMRRKLGQVVASRAGRCAIVISQRHVEVDGWDEVGRTVLHEMVHQWQVEVGLPLGHGPAFRHKAREVGIEPSARRDVPRRGRAARSGG